MGDGGSGCTPFDNGRGKVAKLATTRQEGSGSVSPVSCPITRSSETMRMCNCGKGYCKILSSRKDHSKGKRFYCCPESTGANNHGCGMFEWVVEGGPSITRQIVPSVEAPPPSISQSMRLASSVYARGFLDGAIRGSEQQTIVLKDVLVALNKLEMGEK